MMTADEALCHCGSIREAIEKGEKAAIQMTAADCPVWALQVAVATVSAAMAILVEGGLDPLAIAECQKTILRACIETGGHDGIRAKADAARASLYGRG